MRLRSSAFADKYLTLKRNPQIVAEAAAVIWIRRFPRVKLIIIDWTRNAIPVISNVTSDEIRGRN